MKELSANAVPAELQVARYIDLNAAAERGVSSRAVAFLRSCASVAAVIDGLHAFIMEDLKQAEVDAVETGEYSVLSSPPVVRDDLGPHKIILWPGAQVFSGATIDTRGGPVSFGTDSVVETGALILGPAVIGSGCVIRKGAYIRGDVWLGSGCVVGGEVKHMLALDACELPHHGYVGDSLLGHKAHFGCGSVTANLPLFAHSMAAVEVRGDTFVLGRRKFGAVIGDECQIGCGSVTEPGCLLAPQTLCYPLTRLARGVYGPRELLKHRPCIERVPLKDT